MKMSYYGALFELQSGPRLAVLLGVDRITTSPGRFSVEAAYRIFPPPSTGPIGFSGTN